MTLIVNRKTDNENIKDYQQSLDEIRIYWSEKSVVGRLRDDVSCWWRRLLPASYAQAAQPIHALVHAVIHIVLCSFHSMDFPFNGFCSRAHRLLYRISSGSFFFSVARQLYLCRVHSAGGNQSRSVPGNVERKQQPKGRKLMQQCE